MHAGDIVLLNLLHRGRIDTVRLQMRHEHRRGPLVVGGCNVMRSCQPMLSTQPASFDEPGEAAACDSVRHVSEQKDKNIHTLGEATAILRRTSVI